MLTGVYQIICRVSGNCYVGSAQNIKTRWAAHRSTLRKNRHHSLALQQAWNKHGEDEFDFEIIELCDVLQLREREQFALDSHPSVYNGKRVAEGPSESNKRVNRDRMLANNPNSWTWTPERRTAASEAMSERMLYVDEATPETRNKMSLAAKARCKREREQGIPGPWGKKRLKEGW